MNRLVAALVVLLVAGAAPAMAQLKDGRMMRIVTRNMDPNIPKGHWAGQPIANYRIGWTHTRVEEALDEEAQLHNLVISAKTETWFVNRVNMTAMYHDAGGEARHQNHHVVGPRKQVPPPLVGFELGTEYDFLRSRGARQGRVTVAGVPYDELLLDIEGFRLDLLSHAGAEKPAHLIVWYGGQTVKHIEFVEYEADLEPDYELFKPPPGIQLIDPNIERYPDPDARARKAPPKDATSDGKPADEPSTDAPADGEVMIIQWSAS